MPTMGPHPSMRTTVIDLCYSILDGDPALQQKSVKLLQNLGFTGVCEECGQPCTECCKWCRSCLKLYYPGGENESLGVLIPNDGD